MPAAVRGGSRVSAKPRAKAPPSPKRQQRAPGGRAGAAQPARPTASGGVTPKQVLVAAAALVVLAVGVTLGTGHRGQRLAHGVEHGIENRLGAAGLRLKAIHVEGASPLATADIIQAAGVFKDQPILSLDLEAVRQRIQAVGWVKDAKVVRLLPDTLVIAVVERRQLAVWQHAGRTVVIDDHGEVIPEADPGRFPTLPLIVGEGADKAAPNLLPALAQHPDLSERLDALVRVDDRRWDLRLKDGSLVQLPAIGEEPALMQLEQLEQRSHILELGFERIDLRNPEEVAVRPRNSAQASGQPAAGGV